MRLKERIKNDLIASLKSGDNVGRSVLRLLNSDIKNEEISRRRELAEEEILKVVKSNIKKRREAIELYKRGNRQDLVKQEEDELKILKKYMPEQMSEEEIRKLVQKVILESGLSGASSPQSMSGTSFGKVMGMVIKEAGGEADGNLVSRIVKEELRKIGN